ncbi:hypothetical protein CPC08DRAFT_824474, partial [Agrocybe pediades]
MGHITITLELQQAFLSFPLKEFLEPHSTSIRSYWQLLDYFVTPFLDLLQAMVINDPTLSYIQDHQLGILRSVLMQQIQRYFNDDRQAAIIVLFYHLGLHCFVPVLMNMELFTCYSSPFYPPYDFNESDVLCLSHIWKDSSYLRGDNVYHCFVRQLLCDTLAGQTAECALGPIMHARAALACFKELATMALPPLPSPSGKNIDIALITDDMEDETYWKLRFWPIADNTEDNSYTNLAFDSPNSGQWQFTYDGSFNDEDLCFLLVGYLIFLLPRCGRLDALVAACQDYTRLPEDPEFFLQRMYGRFP